MNEFPRCQNLILFVELLLLGVTTGLTPFMPNLGLFFSLLFLVGFLLASVHTGKSEWQYQSITDCYVYLKHTRPFMDKIRKSRKDKSFQY